MRSQASPWDRQDVVLWTAAVLLGAVISALAWWLAADRVVFRDQVPFASAGVAGLVVASCAHLFWLMRGRRAVGLRRLFLLGDPVLRQAAAEAVRPLFVAVEGRNRYHRPGCPLLEGRTTVTASRNAHEAARRRPCGVCRAEAETGGP